MNKKSTEEKRKIISYSDYLKVEGLIVLARNYHKKADEVEEELAKILSNDLNREDNYGLWSDYMFDDRSVRELLKNLDIVIKK